MAPQPDTNADEVRLALTPPTATITLNRPAEQNRLTRDNLERLGEILAHIAADSAIHAVVVTGAGDAYFSAGLLNPASPARAR